MSVPAVYVTSKGPGVSDLARVGYVTLGHGHGEGVYSDIASMSVGVCLRRRDEASDLGEGICDLGIMCVTPGRVLVTT